MKINNKEFFDIAEHFCIITTGPDYESPFLNVEKKTSLHILVVLQKKLNRDLE